MIFLMFVKFCIWTNSFIKNISACDTVKNYFVNIYMFYFAYGSNMNINELKNIAPVKILKLLILDI